MPKCKESSAQYIPYDIADNILDFHVVLYKRQLIEALKIYVIFAKLTSVLEQKVENIVVELHFRSITVLLYAYYE